MRIIETSIEGLKLFEPSTFTDDRGCFVKIYHDDFFQANGLNISIKETYYSISQKNVIRGMHFQTPPHDHLKIVYVPQGKVMDVVLDIRKNSTTYGTFFTIELSAEKGNALIIPKGMAHGFKSLEENTNVTYLQTSCYVQNHDFGIHYDSFGVDWNTANPIISDRDASFPFFGSFNTPFVFGQN